MDLSIIVISKNQAWNMDRLIESVLQNTECVSTKEILLVDSASSDGTVDVAAQHPIRILQLQPTQHLTPAAGRYLGYKHSTGELILFLDGDMELAQGWLEKALQFLHDRPDVALVTGQVIDLPVTAGAEDKPPLLAKDTYETTEIPYSGGAAMFRRTVLEQVGQFNPYLYSDEEPELCIRIRYAGYRLARIQYPIAYHYSNPIDKLSTRVARWRRNLYLGAGQNLRYHFGDEIFWTYLRERGFGLIPVLGLIIGAITLLWSLKSNRPVWFNLWLLSVGIVIVGDAYRKRSLYRTAVSLSERLFIADGTIRGFLMKPLDPDKYPDGFDIVK